MAESSSKPNRAAATRAPSLRARKAFLVVAGVLSFLLAAGSGFAIGAIHHFERELGTSKIPASKDCQGSGCLPIDPICVNKACNFLVLGSDTRAGLTKQQQQQFGSAAATQGQRADTIIVVQVDPVHDRTIVLSIPRDLRVPIPGHGEDKINTAFNYGPAVMVRTVEQLTGLSINHYAEVNFVGFQALVNALGGVPICIDKPLFDRLAGLNLPHAGCYKLDGSQALAFVRARHIQGDVIPDFSRIARQQQFVRAVIQKSLSIGAVFKISQLIAAARSNLRIDSNLNLYSLQDLTRRLSGLGQGGVEFRVVPSLPVQINGVDYVQLVEPTASILFQRIRQGKALGTIGSEAPNTPISPANITVQVYDANSGGKADQVVSYLERAGFVVLPVKPAPPDLRKSILLWGHGSGDREKVLASYLGALSAFYDNAHTRGDVQTVVIGPDFKGIPNG